MLSKYFTNSRGMSLVGVLIAAAIGLIITMSIAKALINFAAQTEKTRRATDLTLMEQNLVSKLRDNPSWKKSIEKAGGKIPGNNAPIILYDENGNGPWMCPRKGGGNSKGVIIVSRTGLPQNLKCGKCKSDENCGFDKGKFSRIELDVTPNNDELRPSYNGFILDTGGKKKRKTFTTEIANEELYDENQVTCGPLQFLVKVEEGRPICLDQDIGLSYQKFCPDTHALYGFDANSKPLCRPINDYIRTQITNNNNTFVRPADNNLQQQINQLRQAISNLGGTVNNNIRNINRTNNDVNKVKNIIKTLGRSRSYKKVYGSSDSDCASLHRMTCPDGYFMFAYEARMPTAGHNCSIQCRKFFD